MPTREEQGGTEADKAGASGKSSLRALTRYLEHTRAKHSARNFEIVTRPQGDTVEASKEQQQIWLHSELAGDAPIYNEPVTLRFHGELNANAFERAFNYFVARHEAWRTAFAWSNGTLTQSVVPPMQVNLPVLDVRELPEQQREGLALRLATGDARAPFDLTKPPLFRARLVRLHDRDFRLFLTLHHIIFDGVSMGQILVPEIEAAYNAFVQGLEPELPPPPFQYPDYALWQREWLSSGEPERNLHYWKETFPAGLIASALPVDRRPSWARSFSGGTELFQVTPDLRDALNFVAQTSEATAFVTLLAAFHVLLHGETGSSDQAIATVMSSRTQNGSDQVLGYFLNTVLLRTTFSPEQSFRSLIAQVKESVLGALTHPVPFDTLVSKLGTQRNPSSSVPVQAMFILEPHLNRVSDAWDFTQNEVDTGLSKFDLCLWMEERDGYLGRMNFRRDIFEASTITRLKRNWTALLSVIAGNPDRSVAELAESARAQGAVSSAARKPVPFVWLKSIWRGRL